MVMPTDKENQIALKNKMFMNGKTAKQEPIKKPRKCPPIILFGSAEILFGIAKTMNAVDPMLAIITGLSDSMSVMMKTVRAAKELWIIYCFQYGGKLGSMLIKSCSKIQ
tara:strand:+ start:423 stop:749 length:327 start_codon:yes stop_codon:yes gene_type:complete